MKKSTQTILTAVLALHLLPLSAFAQSGLTAATSLESHELSLAEANRAFRNFDAVKEGNDPGSQAVLYGMVFNACIEKFEISNSQIDSTIKNKASDGSVKLGFRITDLGGGLQCMADRAKATCSRANPCTRISEIQGTRLDLGGAPDAKIMLLHTDLNADRSRAVWEDFENPIEHVSRATILANEQASQRRLREARIERLVRQMSNCRKTQDDLALAREARDQLASIGKLDDDEFEKVTKAIDKAEYFLIARKFRDQKSSDSEGRAELIESLKAFAAEHSDYSDSIAVLFAEKAKALVKAGNSSLESLEAASGLIAEAQSMSVSETNSKRLENYQREITVGQRQVEAKQVGSQMALAQASGDPMAMYSAMPAAQEFSQRYGTTLQQVSADMSTSCSSGASINNEACTSARAAYMSLQKTNGLMNQSYSEQVKFYMSQQQHLAGMMGGYFGMPGTAPVGGQNASAFMK